VAAGLCPVALGADGGGSIRIPAAFCGTVGLKPTFGRISVHGAYPLSWSMGHLGPLAASACDAAIAYAVIAGADPADSTTQAQPPVHLNGFGNSDLSGVRLGVCASWLRDACPENIRACEAALTGFQRRGADIIEISLPDLELIRVAHAILIATEMAEAMDSHYRDHRKDFGLDVRLTLALARRLTGGDYIKAQCARSRAITEFARAFKEVDAIISPTTACLAPEIRPDALPDGESDFGVLSDIMRFLAAGNLAGLPAVSFPAAYDGRGMPIGVQAIGRWWDETVVLRLAAIAEEFVERKRPAVYFDLLAD
jgi:Asp-tRNA(Asn)/Glu-tRNA(Gln) amidotransferase A subunit family amidase